MKYLFNVMKDILKINNIIESQIYFPNACLGHTVTVARILGAATSATLIYLDTLIILNILRLNNWHQILCMKSLVNVMKDILKKHTWIKSSVHSLMLNYFSISRSKYAIFCIYFHMISKKFVLNWIWLLCYIDNVGELLLWYK